jgi:ABC-type Fe3+-hydroxamate transport system substrate-binding protein
MKTLILSCVATAAFFSFAGCESDGGHEHRGQTTTTTTEESTVRHPVEATTETRTTRTY